MSGDVHVRFCEGVGVRLPRATHLLVLCNGTKAESHAMKKELGRLLSTMGLTLSEEKTKVTHITEGFNFLGYRVIRSLGTKGKMITKVLVPEKAIKRFREKVREMLAPRTTEESTSAKIQALNRLTRGWCEYYRCTNSPSWVFNEIGTEIFWDLAHWLGRKYESNMPAIMQRFHKEKVLGIGNTKLVMPSEYKAKRFVAKTWNNPYTEPQKVKEEKDRIKRESLFSYGQFWKGSESRPGQGDLREEILLRDGPICAICKHEFHPTEIQVDHIMPYARFKDPADADHLKNLQALCTECHRAKTKIDLKVLSRVR